MAHDVTFRSLACSTIAAGGGVYAALAFGSLADASRLACLQADLRADESISTSTTTSETVRPASTKVAA